VNDPEKLDPRRKELRARLRNDPRTPTKPKWTHEEMREAAQRVITAVIKTGKMPSSKVIQ
jgi:hypothetical protein